jgi:hypothetical protein
MRKRRKRKRKWTKTLFCLLFEYKGVFKKNTKRLYEREKEKGNPILRNKIKSNLDIGIPHYGGFHILYSIIQVFYLTFIGQIFFYLS